MAEPQPRPTILVIEDNDVTREGLAFLLRRAGFNVLTAADGRRALQPCGPSPSPAGRCGHHHRSKVVL